MRGIPPDWTFASRGDVGSHCDHPHADVRIIGNVAEHTIFRCMKCLNEVKPVAPGWVWDVRNQEHRIATADEDAAKAGHARHYLPVG